MNKKIRLIIVSMIVLGVCSSCNLFNTVSVNERIIEFVSDCNDSDKSNMYLNLHPTETTSRSQRIAASTWTEFSSAHSPWSISIVSQTGTTEVTVTGQISNGSGVSNETVTIILKEYETDIWYIKSFEWPAYNSNAGLTIN